MKRLLPILVTFLLLFPFLASAGLNDGLVAYYPFNGNAQDESGNGNDGTVHGAVFVDGITGEGLQFDGVDDYANIPNSASINTSSFTVALWWNFIVMDPNRGETLIEKRNGYASNRYKGNYIIQYASFASSPHTGPFLRVVIGDGSQEVECFKENLELQEGKFYFIVATYDKSFLRLYLDAVEIAQIATAMTANVGDGDINIGSVPTSGHYTNGIIDQLYIYNRALSDSEIQMLYNISFKGDINKDRNVDIADTILALQVLGGIPTLTQIDNSADIDGDNKIGIAEAIYTIRLVAGLDNHAPELELIGNKSVNENELLSFQIVGNDPDGDPLTLMAVNLPDGAIFNLGTKTFTWTPTYDQSGTYGGIAVKRYLRVSS